MAILLPVIRRFQLNGLEAHEVATDDRLGRVNRAPPVTHEYAGLAWRQDFVDSPPFEQTFPDVREDVVPALGLPPIHVIA